MTAPLKAPKKRTKNCDLVRPTAPRKAQNQFYST